MQLSYTQLNAHLKKTLSSVFLISGDEPLLVQDAHDIIILAAQSQGFSEKQTVYIESGFTAETLLNIIYNQNLFSDKKIIDIRQTGGKVDAELFSVLKCFLEKPNPDCLIMVTTEKLTPASQKTSWFDFLKNKAVYVPLWPISVEALPAWITERAKKYNMIFSEEISTLLSHYCEGNLLAAKQTIEKLQLQFADSTVTREQLIKTLSADHARFNLFDFSDALKKKDSKKIIRILSRLQETDEEPVLVLWHITRIIRENLSDKKMQEKMKAALQFAAKTDAVIKGATPGDVWQALLNLSLRCV